MSLFVCPLLKILRTFIDPNFPSMQWLLVARCGMKAGLCRCLHPPSALESPAPRADGVALRWNGVTFYALREKKSRNDVLILPMCAMSRFHGPAGSPRQHDREQSNPHSRSGLPNRVEAFRGFLPRGLYDACPPGAATPHTHARVGRRPTTLYKSGS
jgi:hypothetical protein